ncbi:hypothetical protein ACFVH7_31390 [Kitasatospora indigofera]|uniref:hypothetical protein n=1 Tax=Kitasatospora indigofera TaxID=67307 RepID=UPI00363C7B04
MASSRQARRWPLSAPRRVLTAAAGLTAGALLVRPTVFAHTVDDDGLRTSTRSCYEF